MTLAHGNITATTTPQLVLTADADGEMVTFHNDDSGSAVVRIGSATISTTEGFHLDAKETIGAFQMHAHEELWVVAASGTVPCSWLTH